MTRFHKAYFLLAILLFIIEVCIARYFHGSFIRNYGGDFLVVIFLYCFIKSFLNFPVLLTAGWVLFFAYAVEISQYFHLINLLGLQNSMTAKLILGTTFSFTDLLLYTLGILLVIGLEVLREKLNKILNKQ